MRILLVLFVLNLLFSTTASTQVAVGDWRDHLPYSTVIDVATTDKLMYAATPYSLFYFDEYNGVVTRLSTVQGLSDIGLSSIEYSTTYKLLVITYSNANIDLLLEDGSVYNMPDIKRKNISGNKSINNIFIRNRYVYLSCGFGIVVIDLQKKEIKDTYYIGNNGSHINISDIECSADTLFASSDEGIYKANINNPNLSYFGNWSKMNAPVSDAGYDMIEMFNGKLFTTLKNDAFNDDTIYYYEAGTWHKMPAFEGAEIRGMKVSNNRLVICGYSFISIFDHSLTDIGLIYSYGSLVPNPNTAEYTPNGQFLYIGDQNYGLVKSWNQWSCESIRPTGPFSVNTFSLSRNGQYISTVPGGYNESWSNLYHRAEISVFHDEKWDSYYSYTFPGLDTLFDFVAIQTDPANPSHIFAASYGLGLAEINDNALINVYNAGNSPLSPINGYSKVNVVGLTYDADHNLWITTTGNNKFLSVLKSNGQFKTFSFSSSFSFSSGSSPVIDQNGYKWIALPRAEGIFVFNDNNTLDITSDDQYKKLTTSENAGALPSLNVYSIAVDHDNEIWIGTEAGIGVIYNPVNIFQGGSYDAQRVMVDVGGYVDALLKSEKVKCIAVDGANRKWIGTEKAGAFLVSEDGTEEIFHFTSTNSPMLSNDVNSIAIMPESGEVFFATSSGIISFRGTATNANTSLDSVLVFPNPVMSDFTGYVSVSGLIENAWVTITDIYGTLIYKTQALGGQAVWNGMDMNGTRPATGVYMVFVTNEDGSMTKSAKLMFYH